MLRNKPPSKLSNMEWSLKEAWARNQLNRHKLTAALWVIIGSLISGAAGYSLARITFVDAFNRQEERHIKDILAVRDAYGDKASDMRSAAIEQAKSAKDVAGALVEAAKTLAPEVKKQADIATQAANRSQDAANKIEKAFPADPDLKKGK